MKLLPTTTLALVVLVLASSYFQITMAGGSPAYCNPKCKARCALAGYKERCLKYCGICCMHCNCVPSGTYGNKDECPCYRDLLNSKKKSKCP